MYEFLVDKRRGVQACLAAVFCLLLAGLLWIVITGLLAHSRLDALRGEVRSYDTAIMSGNMHRADAIAGRISAQAASAHRLTSGPAWWVGAHVLVLGTPLRTARDVSSTADRVACAALPRVPSLVRAIRGGHGTAGHVDLARLERARSELAEIHRSVRRATTDVARTPSSWFGPVAAGRSEVLAKLRTVDDDLDGAQQAARTVIPMLGARHEQRYFVAFMNEAESRSIGGLPGAFAVVTADHGRIAVEHIGSDDELANVRANVDLGAQYNRLYGQDDPAGVIQNSDIGPSFPDAGRIWAGMWKAKTGEHVDGAIAIDPSALGYLLQVTGNTELADGTPITAHNVAELAESREYALHPGTDQAEKLRRKKFLGSITQAVAERLLTFGSIDKLASPLRRAVHERRIAVWSDVASNERVINRAGLGDALTPGRAPFSAFFVNNAAGSKLDYYLRRTMTYKASGCGNHRTATASLVLDNDTPTYRLPPYVTYVAGGRPAGTAPGYNKLIVTYYATPGARIRSVLLDGRPQHFTSATEDSLTSVRLLVELPAHAHRTLTVMTSEPSTAAGPLRVVRQPLTSAIDVQVSTPDCIAAAAVPNGPADTGSPWLGVLAGLTALLLVLLATWKTTRAHGFARIGFQLDKWRGRVATKLGALGPAGVTLLGGIAGLAVVTAAIMLLGEATKFALTVNADRPVYRFFLDRRATWLTDLMAPVTHVGEYQEMTAMALAAALVVATTVSQFRVPAFVVLTAVFIWPFITFGKLYDWVDLLALAVFLVLAVFRSDDRGRWISCAVLMTSMPVEKHLQAAVNSVVHGTVPPLDEAYAPVGPFPSGGCTRIVLILGLVAFLFAREHRSRNASVGLALAAASVVCVEGFSRIYLGKHWFVDVLGGYVYGALLLVVFVLVLRFCLGSPEPAKPAGQLVTSMT